MKNSRPLVTVVAVCYNQSRFVIECLESIRRQTYRNIELIIMDDCSQDDSASVIQGWLNATGVSATFVVHTRNRGISKTFNEAIIRAKGQYISIVAADDIYLPNKIELQVALFEQSPTSVGVVYGDAWQIDPEGNLLSGKFIETHRNFQLMPEGHIFPILLRGNFIPAMTTMVRRECYETVGLYDETLAYEDFDMWLRLSRRYRFAFLQDICATCRIVPTSNTRAVMEKNDWVSLRSDFRIFEKCFWTENLTPEQRTYLELRLTGIAMEMYKRKCKGRNYYSLRLIRCHPRKYTFAFFMFSIAGVPFETFFRFLLWWDSFQKRAQVPESKIS